MNKDFFSKLVARFAKKTHGGKPLVTAHHDVTLLQRVREKKLPSLEQVMNASSIMSKKEQIILRLSLLVLLIGLGWFGFVFAGTYRVDTAAVGGRYVEAVVGRPVRANPLYAPLNDTDMDIVRLVYSGLMRIDTKQRLVPDLAASYEVNEDKTQYTFKLREDVFWHPEATDSEPQRLTAEDIVFTFETIQTEAVASPLYLTFQGVLVEALDEKTVRFTLAEPFTPFLSTLTVGILPEHIWGNLTPEQILATQRNLQPVGTGPFKFKRLTKDSTGNIDRFELERFDKYYRQPPFIEEFVFRFFNDYEGDTGAIQALRQQFVNALHFVPTDLKDQVQRKHIQLHTLQLPEYTAVFYNQERQPALADPVVREALALAVDKERILRETLDGEGQIIYSPVLPGFPGYLPEIEKTPFSIDQANELLDEKWPRITAAEYRAERKQQLLDDYFAQNLATSTEGMSTSTSQVPSEVDEQIEAQLDQELNEAQTFYRKNKDGNLLEIKLVTTDTNQYKSAAQRIAGFWQEIGVVTQLSFIPQEEFSKNALRGRLYDALLYGVIIGSDPDQYAFWHSSQTSFPGLNLSQYVNRSVDELLVKAREATDEAVVAEAYEEFQQILLEQRPALFLYMPTYTYATTGEISGLELSRIFSPSDRFAGVIYWYLRTKGTWNF